MIPLTELPLKDQNSLDSTREELSPPEKFNLPSNLSYPENFQDTQSLKVQRQSQNTFSNDPLNYFNLSQSILFYELFMYNGFQVYNSCKIVV